jgi:hypothetical protein
MTTLHTTRAIALLAAALLAGTAHAAPRCVQPEDGSPAFEQAYQLVAPLPELKAWSRTHKFPVAFSGANEALERDGRCYVSVAVSADRPERMELWHLFYVHVPSRAILVVDPVSGDPVTLQAWRAGQPHKKSDRD